MALPPLRGHHFRRTDMRSTSLLSSLALAFALALVGCDAGTTSDSTRNPQTNTGKSDGTGEEIACGGIAGLTCPADHFCYFPEGTCLEPDATGTCVPNGPTHIACPQVYQPVCGCDGQTYGNRCVAGARSVSIAHDGPCEVEYCGGWGGRECAEGSVCQYGEGSCGAGDRPGVCVPRPEACAYLYEPVCGCDNQTYSNECLALQAGVSVKSQGACEPEPQGCGGLAGLRCADGYVCQYPEDSFCGGDDRLGTCAVKPEACAYLYEPVCGCDDQTYSNECLAHQAGVSVKSQGACGGVPCGRTVCGAGSYCCNPIMDICAPIGMACIQ
jgi:hypothetical protein